MILLGFDSDLQVVPGIAVSRPGFAAKVAHVLLIYMFAVDVALPFLLLLSQPLILSFFGHLLGEQFVLLAFDE